MTIVQLEYLLAVVNYGSFSIAAKHCFVAQPSLSVQIQNLEDELGIILLYRNSRPVVPTEAGLPIVEHARRAVAEFYAIREKANEVKGVVSGKLRLGVIPTVSPYLMPRFIPEFTKRHPDVELEIGDIFPTDVIAALSRDMIDIAIFSLGELPANIEATKLFTDKLYAYVSLESELYDRDVIYHGDMDPSRLMTLSEGICLCEKRNEINAARKKIKASYNFTTASLETLMRTVDASSGLTLIPGMVVGYVPAERRGQIKPFGEADAYRTIAMATGRTFVKKSLADAVRKTVMSVADLMTRTDV
jgi:LysR family hydrogen peroxide-inducible transcriptional activator